jgi:hypothetical protein
MYRPEISVPGRYIFYDDIRIKDRLLSYLKGDGQPSPGKGFGLPTRSRFFM